MGMNISTDDIKTWEGVWTVTFIWTTCFSSIKAENIKQNQR